MNISIFVGYKLKKLTGSVICALGTILPSFLIILAIALFFTQFRENEWVEKAFKGLRPAVVALIAVPVITTARSLRLRGWVLVIPVVVALSIWLLSLSPVYIIIVAAAGGLYYRMYLKRH